MEKKLKITALIFFLLVCAQVALAQVKGESGLKCIHGTLQGDLSFLPILFLPK